MGRVEAAVERWGWCAGGAGRSDLCGWDKEWGWASVQKKKTFSGSRESEKVGLLLRRFLELP